MPTLPLTLFQTRPSAESTGRTEAVVQHIATSAPGSPEAGREIAALGRDFTETSKQLLAFEAHRRDAEARARQAADKSEAISATQAAQDLADAALLDVAQSPETNLDVLNAKIDTAFVSASSAVAPRVRRLTPEAQQYFQQRFTSYRLSAQAEAYRTAISKFKDAETAKIAENGRTAVRQYYQTNDPAIRAQIGIDYLDSISTAAGTILTREEAERYKKSFLDDLRKEGRNELVNSLPFPELLDIAIKSKDMLPTERNELIRLGSARNSMLYELDRRAEAADEKESKKRRNLNAARLSADVNQAIVRRDNLALLSYMTISTQASDEELIDPEDAQKFHAMIRVALTAPTPPVRDDPKVVAGLLQRRLNEYPGVGQAAVNAAVAGDITPTTASGFVDDDIAQREKDRYYNLDVYKQYFRALKGQAVTTPFVSIAAQALPSMRNELARIQADMELAYESDVRAFAQQHLADTPAIQEAIPQIYRNTIERYRPAITGLSQFAKPRTATVQEAINLRRRDVYTDEQLAEELVLHALAGDIDPTTLSPKGQALYERLHEAYKYDLSVGGIVLPKK